VRMRTIADRPLGLFLSSGIDSTVIASRLAAQHLAQFRSFTAAFPGSEMDEAPLARETASTLGLANTAVPVPDAVGEDFARIVASLDEPFADPSSFPSWYLARETASEVKVVLVGDGGDELFAGYKRIAQHLRSGWRGAFRLPLPLRASLGGSKLVDELAMPWEDAYSLRFSGFTPSQRAFLHAERGLPALVYWRAPDAPGRDKLGRLAAIDYANYLPEYILRKSDLCTMAHGLEARAPLLDHRFVQRILAVPDSARYTVPPKRLLRQAVDERLPAALFERKKRGFNPPLRDWLRVKLAGRLDGLGARVDALTNGQLATRGIDDFVQAYRQGAERLAEQVLQLLILDESLAQLKAAAR
jgi:asparagine synthase (glutamine-hydrolysing)